jgi:hypothetical protein
MIASARARQRARWALFFSNAATFVARGLASETFGPRLAGVSAPRVPASRWRRQSQRVDE